MAFLTDDISFNTILGEGSFFANEVKINGNVRIQGDVDGNIETKGNIFIGEKSRIKGDIIASSAEIFGVVIGDITADKGVTIHSSATVIGDVFAKKVQIEDKSIFNGHCISIKNDEDYEKAKNSYITEKSILMNKIEKSKDVL